MPQDTNAILKVAGRAAQAAAGICRAVLEESDDRPDSMSKIAQEPVTVADYGSQAVILREVRKAFPEHGVISEEGSEHLQENAGEAGITQITRLVSDAIGRSASFEEVCEWIDHEGPAGAEFVWAIDPIDGTKGFLRRDQYAVAIGLLRNGKPFAGALACPNLPVDASRPDGPKGVLFLAAEGCGATAESILNSAGPAPVKVSGHVSPEQVRVMGSVESSHGDPKLLLALMKEMGLSTEIVRIDSQAKYGVVSRGYAEIYLRPRSRPDWRENIWDHAAGVIINEQAGGRVTDLDGNELDFARGKKLEDNRGIVATNGAVHDQVLDCLRRIEARN